MAWRAALAVAVLSAVQPPGAPASKVSKEEISALATIRNPYVGTAVRLRTRLTQRYEAS